MKIFNLVRSLVFAGVGLTIALPVNALVISYPDFSDLSDFTLNGTAGSLNPDGNVLNLTNTTGQSASAFLTNTVSLANQASFSTAFQFQITNPSGISDSDGQGADGIVFVVQTVASNVGGGGGGIGYSGIRNSVGIEFDTWNNGSVDDSSGNHVGIDLGGSVDSVLLTPIANRMNNGAVWSAWIDYDGLLDSLEVRIAEDGIRPNSALLSLNVDLVAQLGTPDAFIGFTSGTGSAGGDHDILNWEFVDDFAPIDDGDSGPPPPVGVPEPSTISLLAMGLVLLGLRRRRRSNS